ncbi:MAG: HTH-type transcriptional regulator Hpr [Firmicutes bacterium ADurb.Bin182]|nr:MAG: HTH-type transcriptional regulator Hpr [Firmicutes bacterium ADurb.Bin182]
MRDSFSVTLNELLVNTYRTVLRVEEQMIKNMNGIDLSINELHMLEFIGNSEEGATISDIARVMDITLPSVTVAIKKLEKKGYIQKIKCKDDGRIVHVILTRTGKKIDAMHRYFHEQMIRNISKEIREDEKELLLKAMVNLNEFFKKKLAAMKSGRTTVPKNNEKDLLT